MCTWNMFGVKTRLKTFLFQFFNNNLTINTRTSHFRGNGEGGNRACTLCSIAGIANAQEESFLHLFLDCPTAKVWRESFTNQYHLNEDNTDLENKKLWLLGYVPIMRVWNLMGFLCIMLFQFIVWEQKLQKRVPSYNRILTLYKEELYQVISSKKCWILEFENLNFPLRRILLTGAAGDGEDDGAPRRWQGGGALQCGRAAIHHAD
jgi:hypothetical protein